MVIIQLVGEALGELFRNPELLCAHVTKLIRTASLKEELDWYNVRAGNSSAAAPVSTAVTLFWLCSISSVGCATQAAEKRRACGTQKLQ